MRFFLLFLVCIFGVVLLACQADGQETQGPSQDPKTPAAEKPDDTPQGSVKQSPLKTYYLRRKDGSLVPYFTIPFEEFDEMYKLYQGISAPDRPPRFILRDISITGFVKDDLATLNCSFQIFTKADGWVRVPIGMNELILRESSTESPASQFIMEFDKGGDGYVCRIQGKQNQKHTVKLTMLAKVQKAGDRRQFSFATAHSSESNFELIVPEPKIESLFEGRGVDDVQAIANGKSKLTVIGLGGEVRIAWRPKTESVAKARAFLQVASEVLVTVDRQRIVYQAEFQVESFRTPFDSFLVRVPRDLKVNELADDQRGYRIKVLAQDDPRFAKHARKSQLVEVLLNQTKTSTKRILLVGERARGGNPNSPITISGFEVLDAILHSGEFNLSVVQPDSTVHWELPSGLTPLESIPDRLRRSNVLARFAFYGADPWTLRVTVAEKTKTLRIEPTYFFLIQPDRVVLSAELKCRLAGASVKNLEVHLPGWTINDVGPSQWV